MINNWDRFNWSRSYKWLITITTCFMWVRRLGENKLTRGDSSILTGLPAGSYSAGNSYMEQAFGISQDNFPWLTWATTSWNVGGLGEIYRLGRTDIIFRCRPLSPAVRPTHRELWSNAGVFCTCFPRDHHQAHTKADLLYHIFDLPRAIRRGYQLCDHDHHKVLRRRGELGFHQHCRRDHRRYCKLELPSSFMC